MKIETITRYVANNLTEGFVSKDIGTTHFLYPDIITLKDSHADDILYVFRVIKKKVIFYTFDDIKFGLNNFKLEISTPGNMQHPIDTIEFGVKVKNDFIEKIIIK